MAEIPDDLILFKLVPSPAENIINTTPISAKNLIPARAESFNKLIPGILSINAIIIPASSIPTTWGILTLLHPICKSLDNNKINAKGRRRLMVSISKFKNIINSTPNILLF